MRTSIQKTDKRARKRAMFAAKAIAIPLIATAVFAADTIQRNIAETEVIGIQDEDDDGLSNTLRSHYVRMGAGNAFGGTISGIDSATGKARGIGGLEVFLVQKSKVIEQGETDVEGKFQFKGVKPGTYSFCVAGRNGFLAYGLHLIAPAPTPADGADSTDESLDILTQWNVGAPMTITAAVVPPEFKALRKIMSDLLPSSLSQAVGVGTDNVRINVEKSVVEGGFQIMLGDDGQLKGRITPIGTEKGTPIRLREMNVFLIQDDEVYARTTVAEDGTFEFKDVEEGVYGFAAAGKDGFGAISFQAVIKKDDDTSVLNENEQPFRFTSIREPKALNELTLAICPPEDSDFLKRKMDEIAEPAIPELAPDVLPRDFPVDSSQISPFVGEFGFPQGPTGPNSLNGVPRSGRLATWGGLGLFIAAVVAASDNDRNITTLTPTTPAPTSPLD